MEEMAADTHRSSTAQSGEADRYDIDDSHFQLPIGSSNFESSNLVHEGPGSQYEDAALAADISDNDSTGSWEKIEPTFAQQVLIDLDRQRKNPSNRKSSELPVVDYDLFYQRIIEGDLESIEADLNNGANIEREDDDGITPLVLAIKNLQFDTMQLLLEKGAEVDHAVERQPPIAHALKRVQDAVRMIKMLMNYGADPNIVSGRSNFNALHWATFFGVVDAVAYLADVGMDLDSTCSQGRTALILAAEKGLLNVIKLLLTKGAELAKQSRNGGTALTWAASQGHLECVTYLLEKGLEVNHSDETGITPLAVASNAGHLMIVELLIEKGANVNVLSSSPNDITPVSTAARAGHTEVVKTLLRSGAELNLPLGNGHRTLEASMTAGHHETVKVLLENLGGPEYPVDSVALQLAMADTRDTAKALMAAVSLMFPHVQSRPDIEGDCAWMEWVLRLGGELVAPKAMAIMLHVAMTTNNRPVVNELLRLGADPNQFLPGRPGSTPLALAIGTSDVEFVTELLAHGANPAGRVDKGADDHETALQQAIVVMWGDQANECNATIVDLLIASGRCKINKGVDMHHTAFSILLCQLSNCKGGTINTLARRMIEHTPDVNEERTGNGSSLMHVAVSRDARDVIDFLLEKGANMNAEDNMGQTPFLRTCYNTTTILPFLVERGADVFAKDKHGQSALHIAASTSKLDTMQYLLDHGLNIEETGPGGYTPLITALTYNLEDAALWLIDHGASISATTCDGKRTTLHHACIRGMHRVVERLLSIDPSVIGLREDSGQTAFSLACQKGSSSLLQTLISHGADAEARDDAGDAPLHVALESGNEDAALFLITHGVDVSACGMDNCTLLHLAAEYNHIRAIRLFLDRGVDVDAVDDYGRTPLCVVNHIPASEMLVKAGAKVEFKDTDGWTPVHHAVHHGSLGLFAVLVKAGADMEVKAGDDGLSVMERIRRVGWRDWSAMQRLLRVLEDVKEAKRWEEMKRRMGEVREGGQGCRVGCVE